MDWWTGDMQVPRVFLALWGTWCVILALPIDGAWLGFLFLLLLFATWNTRRIQKWLKETQEKQRIR